MVCSPVSAGTHTFMTFTQDEAGDWMDGAATAVFCHCFVPHFISYWKLVVNQ